MKLKIVYSKPPQWIWDRAEKEFGLSKIPNMQPVFTYGNTIYSPWPNPIDDALMAHEAVHSYQQGSDPEGWWKKYFDLKEFRLAQEIEAYRAHYKAAKITLKDGNALARFKNTIAKDLSGPMYGNLMTYQAALIAIGV